jgi:glycosyltransferase involved in cell wall biosynthesis
MHDTDGTGLPDTGALDPRERRAVAIQRWRWRWRERLQFDVPVVQTCLGAAGLAAGSILRMRGRGAKALRLESALHRAALGGFVDRTVEQRIARARVRPERDLQRHAETVTPVPATRVFFEDPGRLLGKRVLVLKSPGGAEKGVIVVDYFFVFPLLARFFDIDRIASRYHIVLEPSWSGYCEPDLLCLMDRPFPLFVQAYEPRDVALLERLDSNLIPVPTSANWWIDHRVFRPIDGAVRDADALFLAAWAGYKRHDGFLHALATLRRRGERLKAILVGYDGDWRRADIERLIRYHGVADQVEIFERVPPSEVNRQLNRVKVNVLWSRREGVNRAIIEGMCAGVPALLREGFNYGYHYPYINDQTGGFASERSLPDRLLEFVRSQRARDPRAWVLDHMSPQRATAVIDESIGAYARAHGEPWTEGRIAVKVTSLNAMAYWDEDDRERFAPDYAFLRSTLRAS